MITKFIKDHLVIQSLTCGELHEILKNVNKNNFISIKFYKQNNRGFV